MYSFYYDYEFLKRNHPFLCAGLRGSAKASFVVNDLFIFVVYRILETSARVFCELMT